MAKDWDRENMKTISVNLKKEEAEAFRALANEHGTTVGTILRLYIRSLLSDERNADRGLPHIVSYRNTDRLKHETAFHNPDNLNPNGVLNEILDRYFSLVDDIRR